MDGGRIGDTLDGWRYGRYDRSDGRVCDDELWCVGTDEQRVDDAEYGRWRVRWGREWCAGGIDWVVYLRHSRIDHIVDGRIKQ